MKYYIDQDMVNDKIIVCKEGGYKGVIDTNNNIIIPIENEIIEFISYNHIIVKDMHGKFSLYDNKNKIAIKDYGDMEYLKNGFILLIKKQDDEFRYGIYNINRKEVIIFAIHHNISYCKYQDKHNHIKSMFIVDYNKLYNSSGLRKEIPYEVHFISDFEEGFARFTTDCKYGVLNINGDVVIKPGEYDYISDFKNKCCIVKKGHFYGMVNNEMQCIIEPKYKKIANINKKGNTAILTVDDVIGYIDINGKEHLISID